MSKFEPISSIRYYIKSRQKQLSMHGHRSLSLSSSSSFIHETDPKHYISPESMIVRLC